MVEIPRGAERLQRKAPELGWRTEMLAASGTWRNKPIDLVCVWCERDDPEQETCSAVAQWVNGKADTCWVWPWPEPPGIHKMGHRELMTYLAENGNALGDPDR